MKNKYAAMLALLGVLTLAIWIGVVLAVLALVRPAQAAGQMPVVTKTRVALAPATEAERDKALGECSSLHNAARVVADDRLYGVQQEREVLRMESSKRLTNANRAMYRMLIAEIYALPEQQVRRYPALVFGECIAGAH